MEMARIKITKRVEPLQSRGDRKPALTAANNAARERKFADSTPTKSMRMATKTSGNNWNKREIFSCNSGMPSTRSPTRVNASQVTQNKERVRSSEMGGRAALRNTWDAPDSSDRRLSWVNGRIKRSRYFIRSATNNPASMMSSMATRRGRNTEIMCTKFL